MTKYIRFYLFIILITFFFSGCSIVHPPVTYNADKGSIDLRGFDFTGKTLNLDGLWGFYWNKLLTYDELQKNNPDLYVDVPSAWNNYSIHGKKLPGVGYATYRLHVVTDLPEDTVLGLRLNTFSSAYRLFINDRQIASNGTAADNERDEVGEYRPQAAYFPVPAHEFDIIIQVSNFEYARGGFWSSLRLGSADRIVDFHDNTMGREQLAIGVLLIIALYYLTLYLFQREFKFSLYFSCFCFLLVLTLDTLGQFIISRVFDGIDFGLLVFIWYSATNWIVFFLILMMHELFRSKFSSIILRIFLILISIFQLIILFTKPVFYSRLGIPSNIMGILAVFFTLIIIILGIKNRRRIAWLNLCCMLIIFLTFLHDNFYWLNIIKDGELIYFGIFLCIFLQIIMQTLKIKEFINQSISTELAYLQAQIKPHFLYNTINTFISMTYYDIEKARELLQNFSDYLRRSFDFKEPDQFVPLKNEIELAKAYANIEMVRFEERLQVSFDLPEDMEYMVPILVLQPLIENSIIHGVLPKPEGGHVEAAVRPEGKQLFFKVKDNGIGFAPDKMAEGKSRSRVGLDNINKRLKKLYGKGLNIKSSLGEGTEITWYVPIKERQIRK
jgi:sensor histidine kinase YesM